MASLPNHGKYSALFDEPSPGAAPADHGKYSALFDEEPAAPSPPAAPPEPPKEPEVGGVESFVRKAGAQVPFGRQAEAAFNTLPVVGTGKSYAENLADGRAREDAAQRQHPTISDLGTGTGFAGTAVALPMAAEGKLLAGAGALGARLVGPAITGVQGGLNAASESKAPDFKGKALDALAGTATGAAVGAATATAAPVVARVAHEAADVVKNLAPVKWLSSKFQDRVIKQGVADVVGSNDPLIGSATMTDKKHVIKAAQINATKEAPYGQLGKELQRPEVQTITDAARTDPEEALAKLNKLVTQVHAPAIRDYATIDHATGGFAVDDLHQDILNHVKKIERPANETTEGEFQKLADSIEKKWKVPEGSTEQRPTTDLRRLVTDLRETASNTLGSLKESEGYKVREELADVAFKSLNRHLDQAAEKGGPEIKAAVERVRESNRRVAALLSLQDALETRIIKTKTMSMTRTASAAEGRNAGAWIGGGVGAAIGHKAGPIGSMVGAGLGGAVGGAVGRTVAPPLARATQAVDRSLARIALEKLRDPSMGPKVQAAIQSAIKAGATAVEVKNVVDAAFPDSDADR